MAVNALLAGQSIESTSIILWNMFQTLGMAGLSWGLLVGPGTLPVPRWFGGAELSFLAAFLAGEEWALGVQPVVMVWFESDHTDLVLRLPVEDGEGVG